MAYAVLQDAIDLYGEDYVLTSVDRDSDGSPDTDEFTNALDWASNFIDSYLATKYDVPISPTPDILQGYCIDIAIYRSCPTRNLTEEKRKRYEDAVSWLKDVAAGKATLGIDDTGDATNNETVEVASENPVRLFNRTKLGGLL